MYAEERQQAMAALIAHLGVERLDWVGTSLGGLVGMVLAGAQNTPTTFSLRASSF